MTKLEELKAAWGAADARADAAAYDADYADYPASAARAARAAARAAADRHTFWQDVDPIGVLERMTYLDTHKKSED